MYGTLSPILTSLPMRVAEECRMATLKGGHHVWNSFTLSYLFACVSA